MIKVLVITTLFAGNDYRITISKDFILKESLDAGDSYNVYQVLDVEKMQIHFVNKEKTARQIQSYNLEGKWGLFGSHEVKKEHTDTISYLGYSCQMITTRKYHETHPLFNSDIAIKHLFASVPELLELLDYELIFKFIDGQYFPEEERRSRLILRSYFELEDGTERDLYKVRNIKEMNLADNRCFMELLAIPIKAE